MHAGSGQLYMLASVVVWYARKRKLCKAPHSTAPDAGHDTARHRTALRRAVGLAKRNEAGACDFCAFSYTQLGVTRKENLGPHLLKAITCAHVLP